MSPAGAWTGASDSPMYLRRMGDLSLYMKELKQWISRVYNMYAPVSVT